MDQCFNNSSKDLELLDLRIKHPHIKPFNVIRVYRPPSGDPKQLVNHLDLHLPELVGQRAKSYLLGDFNIDHNSILFKKIRMDKLESKLNILQQIKDPTWITQTTKTLKQILEHMISVRFV